MKQKMLDKKDTPISFSYFPSSIFINLSNSSDEDVCLPMSSNMNVFGSFSAPILDVYLVEDVPSNLNQV